MTLATSGTGLSAFLTQPLLILEKEEGRIVPEKRQEFERDIRAEAENLARTFKLRVLLQQQEQGSISETDFSAELSRALWWLHEYGTKNDLTLLQKIKKPPHVSESILKLIDRVESEIRKRDDTPDEILEREEAAYQLPLKTRTFPVGVRTLVLSIVEIIVLTLVIGGGIFGLDLVWTQLAVLTGLGAGLLLIFLGIHKSDDLLRRIFLHASGAAILFETSIVLWTALSRLPR